MSVATVLLLVASLSNLSCRTAYQKVVTDTHRTDEERSLLAKACKEEFPSSQRFVPGSMVHRDTSFVYDEEAITELNMIIDSLLVLDESNRERLRMRADSITHLLWNNSKKPCITEVRVDTIYTSDSVALYRAFEVSTALREDLVKAHGETIEAGIERDAAKVAQKEAEGNVNFWRLFAIAVSVAFACYIFRKPLLRGVIAIFNPVKI